MHELRMIGALVAMVLSLSTVSAHAQGTKTRPASKPAVVEKKWDREPSTVFGILLGGEVNQESLPACAVDASKAFVSPQPTSLCYFTDKYARGEYGELHATPDLGFWYRATLFSFQNRIHMLALASKQVQFDKTLAVLTEKYGEPTQSEVTEVTARSGARLQSRVVRWTGDKVVITARERSNTIDDSLVTFQHIEATKAKADAGTDQVRGAASKL